METIVDKFFAYIDVVKHKKYLSYFKSVKNKKYDNGKNLLCIPNIPENIQLIKNLGFKITQMVNNNYVLNSYIELFPFQLEGVEFIVEKDGKALIADEMGLGKTIQALGYISIDKTKTLPALVICLSSLKFNWKREIYNVLGKNINIELLNGKKPRNIQIRKNTIYIISYAVLWEWKNILSKADFETIVIDETHYIKNPSAKRTKAAKQISKNTKNIICLSGTPILAKPFDLWNVINILKPGLFTFKYFTKTFCDPKFNGYRITYDGATDTKKLHNILKKYIMIRRKKEDVLDQLPEKFWSYVLVNVEKSKEYNKTLSELRSKRYNVKNKVEMYAKLSRLKYLSGTAKIKQSIEWIDNFFYTNPGKKLIVYAHHKYLVSKIHNNYKKSLKLDGSTPSSKRGEIVDNFNNTKKYNLLVCNIQSGGVGLNLVSCDTILYVELPWNPSDVDQAADRIHRIGQTSDRVFYYVLLGIGTIDELLIKVLDRKRSISTQIVDGADVADFDVMNEVMKGLKDGKAFDGKQYKHSYKGRPAL